MKKIVSLSLVLASFTMLSASVDSEKLAVEKCGGCHLMGVTSKEKLKNMSAPPYWAISKKVKEAYAKREDAVNYIVDYTLSPAKEKMLFSEQTIKMFGMMPSQKGNVTEDEIRVISEYILGE